MFRKIGWLVLLLSLSVIPQIGGNLSAQEPLTQTYDKDGLSFQYPDGWQLYELNGIVGFSNDSNFRLGWDVTEMQDGKILIAIIGPRLIAAIPTFFPSDATIEERIQLLIEQFSTMNEDFQPIPVQIGGLQGISYFEGEVEAQHQLIHFVLFGNGGEFMLSARIAGDYALYEDLLMSILETLHYDSSQTVVRGEVIWQWQQEWEQYHLVKPGFLGDVAIGPAGSIYIADTSAIRVFSADGSMLPALYPRTIDNVRIEVSDVAVSQSGVIWVADKPAQKIFYLDEFGSWLELTRRASDQARPDGQLEIEIGPHNRLYVYSERLNSSNERVGVLQIFEENRAIFSEAILHEDQDTRLSNNPQLSIGLEGHFYLHSVGLEMIEFALDGTTVRRFGFDILAQVGAIGPDGSFYLWNGPVYRYDAELRYLQQFGEKQPLPLSPAADMPPFEAGQFYNVRGMAVAPNGDLIVADINNTYAQVVRIRMDE